MYVSYLLVKSRGFSPPPNTYPETNENRPTRAVHYLVLLCHITDKSTAGGGMISNRLENKTNIKRLNGWLI